MWQREGRQKSLFAFLPAAKPAGHRTESVVVLVVVVVVGVTLSPARISYPSTLKKDCVGNRHRVARYYAFNFPFLPSMPWQLCLLFSNTVFFLVY